MTAFDIESIFKVKVCHKTTYHNRTRNQTSTHFTTLSVFVPIIVFTIKGVVAFEKAIAQKTAADQTPEIEQLAQLHGFSLTDNDYYQRSFCIAITRAQDLNSRELLSDSYRKAISTDRHLCFVKNLLINSQKHAQAQCTWKEDAFLYLDCF